MDGVEETARALEAAAKAEGERLRGDRPKADSPNIDDLLGGGLRAALRDALLWADAHRRTKEET